jgi:epsilon-lactone hydrolase
MSHADLLSLRRAEVLKSMIRIGMRFVPHRLDAYRFFVGQGHWLFPAPPNFRTEPFMLEGMPALWLSHKTECTSRVILYLHGGGYALGSNRTHLQLACGITRAAQAQTMMIEYRLAPENPYPAAVDDAVIAYRWLLDHGTKPHQIVIMGDSAGGGLTMATLMALRDQGLPSPAGAVCLSPWLDLTCEHASASARAHRDPFLTSERICFFSKLYAGEHDPKTPGVSPLYGDFHDLPPVLVQVGGDEILLNESKELRRMTKGKHPIDVQIWPHMFHVWHFAARWLPQGKAAIREVGDFVRERVPLPSFSRKKLVMPAPKKIVSLTPASLMRRHHQSQLA